MKINKNTKLCVLNARWGSRLTLNLNFSKNSIETGTLGIDQVLKEKPIFFHQKLQQLKFYVKAGDSEEEGFYFSKLNSFLAEQELSLGLTYIKLKGTHSSELNVEFSIFNPVSVASNLENDESIKILHTPIFIIEFSIKNNSNYNQNISTFIGFDMKGQLINGVLYYDDDGKNNIGKQKNILYLHTLQSDDIEYHKDEDGKTRGFLVNKDLSSGENMKLKFICGGFTNDVVFINKLDLKKPKKLKFYYTKFYDSVEDILAYAESNYAKLINSAQNFEFLLNSYKAPPEKKFLISLAFRSFLANTWLLLSEDMSPEYYVWEGTYGLNSTVDVAMEVELLAKIFPWTLKLQLQQWKKYITINQNNGFYYLMHDVGADQEVGYSYYEKVSGSVYGISPADTSMAVEENSNYMILLYWYYYVSGDNDLLEELYPTAFKLLLNNIKRGFRKRGIANMETTSAYNASDVLHDAPLNIYLGIKECVAYIMGNRLSEVLKLKKNAKILYNEAEKILETLEYTKEQYDYIPVSLDTNFPGWNKKTIATLDPLFYVAMTDLRDPIIIKIIRILGKDFEPIYHRNDTLNYGVRLVEDEEFTWFSKIAIIEAVSTLLLQNNKDSWKYPYERNKNNPMAYCDGAFSEKREWNGKRYPRGVSLMWEIIYNHKK
jgi:hypothetical protein